MPEVSEITSMKISKLLLVAIFLAILGVLIFVGIWKKVITPENAPQIFTKCYVVIPQIGEPIRECEWGFDYPNITKSVR